MKRLKQTRIFKKKGILYLKLLSIFYLSFTLVAYLTSSTNASFNDVEEVSTLLSVGTWEIEDPPEQEKGCSENHDGWDCSSLEFVKSGYEVLENGSVRIYAEIKNNSENDMTIESGGKSFVYYISSGNPKNGVELDQVPFENILAGESRILEFVGELESGMYKFLAYQSEGHQGKGELWSDPIEVPEISGIEAPLDPEDPGTDESSEKEKSNQEETEKDEKKESKDDQGKENKDISTEETVEEEHGEEEPIIQDPNPEEGEDTVPPPEKINEPETTPVGESSDDRSINSS